MLIHYVLDVNPGQVIGVQPADAILVILCGWLLKRRQNQSYGCQDIFPYYSKLRNEARCTFKPCNCPYAGSECKLVGDNPFLVI
jgi:hypothetical protein